MFKLFNPILNKRAQIALPSVMLIPIMLLVIYLLLETAKLSREKVRQQFAVDTAAFAEMTNTSNFLNLASYTNVFPYKLFREVWPPEPKDIELDRDSNIVVSGGQNFPSAVSRYDIITAAGAFPFMPPGNPEPKPTDIEWQILYPEGTDRAGWMTETPNINTSTVYDFWNKDMVAAYKYNRVVPGAPDVNIDMPAFGSYLAYYILLSKMYKDQRSYYDRISNDEGEFYRRGYIQNICGAKECVCRLNECGREGARYFKGSTIKTVPVYIDKMMFYMKGSIILRLHYG